MTLAPVSGELPGSLEAMACDASAGWKSSIFSTRPTLMPEIRTGEPTSIPPAKWYVTKNTCFFVNGVAMPRDHAKAMAKPTVTATSAPTLASFDNFIGDP